MDAQNDEYVDRNSELGRLIVKLNHLEKKPLLDNSLAELLDFFLQRLKQSDEFLVNGIFQINFAEAALLLQSSACIYSKKVDLLWDSVNQYQKRMIAYNLEGNDQDLEKLQERELKYKRKRKNAELLHQEDKRHKSDKTESFNIDWKDLNDFQNVQYEKDSRLYSRWFKKMVVKLDLQPVSKDNGYQGEKYSHFRGSENGIHDKDQDDELVVHVSKMESVMSLDNLMQQNQGFNVFSFQLFTDFYLMPKFLSKHQLEYDNLEKKLQEFGKFLSIHKDRLFLDENADNYFKSPSPELRQTPQKLRRLSVSSTVVSRLTKSDLDKIYGQKCQVNLLRLSLEDLNRLSRLSIDEMEECFASQHDNGHAKLENFQDTSPGNNDFNADCDVEFIMPEIIDIGDEISSIYNRQKEIGAIGNEQDLNNSDSTKMSSDCVKQNNDSERTSEKLDTMSDIFAHKIDEMYYKDHKKVSKRKIEDCETDNEIPEKRRRLSKAAIKKLATGITVDSHQFNLFFAANYIPEEGEGQVDIPVLEFVDPIESSSRIDLEEDLSLSQETEDVLLCTQDSGYESRILDDSVIDNTNRLSPIDCSTNITREEKETWKEENNKLIDNSTHSLIESENIDPSGESPLYQRLYEWKQHMAEKFKTTSSSDFDIHQYGSNIMESFNESNCSRKFCDIVEGKSSAEVTRFFISALQLANTGNIEIQGGSSGRLSNETLSFKLITKNRCYDRLKDYVAPSEMNYHERLKNAQRLKKKHDKSSTFSGCSGRKYRKYI